MYLANPEIDRTPINPEEVHDSLFVKGSVDEERELFPVYPESQGISSLLVLPQHRQGLEGERTHAA